MDEDGSAHSRQLLQAHAAGIRHVCTGEALLSGVLAVGSSDSECMWVDERSEWYEGAVDGELECRIVRLVSRRLR